jgi:hypothetical protein
LEQARRTLRIGETRSKRFHDVAKGYAGWLMTHRPFLGEHDQLQTRFHEAIKQWGLPYLGRATTGSVPDEIKIPATPALRELCDALIAFFVHWRLSGLAAPNLPGPLQPMTPVPAPFLAMGPMNQAGGLFFFPDTFPIPSRDELRGIFDESLRSGAPEHLAQWVALIARGNTAKNQITRFGRLLELQHYVRILHERHASAVHRRIGQLKGALAKFIGVDEATIHGDLLFVARRLGPDWMLRGNNPATTAPPITSTRRRRPRKPK